MNRFTDTEIWTKPWYRKLPPAEKLAWQWLLSECDNVGVINPDFELAEFVIGAPVDWQHLAENCNGNIEVLECGKWWFVDFVRVQHADLFADYEESGKEPSKPCRSYVRLLQKHGLYERFPELFKAFGKPIQSLCKGYKEREEEKDREEVEASSRPDPYEKDFGEAWSEYPRKQNRKGAYKAYCATRRKGVEAGELLGAVTNFAREMSGKDEQFIMHGATFFGPNERWRDSVATKVSAVQYRKVCEVCAGEFIGEGLRCPSCK